MADHLTGGLFTAISPTSVELPVIRLGCQKTAAKSLVISRLLALFIALFSVAAAAGELPDPTRPPPGIIAVPESEIAESQPSGLQSIIISKKRRAAIIDGETVELGGKHGDAKLIEVNEGNVVLQRAQGRQVLSLFPDVKITSKKMKTKLPSPAGSAQHGKQQAKPAAPGEEP